MRRRDGALILIALVAILCGGCSGTSHGVKSSGTHKQGRLTPRYQVRDTRETRQRLALQETLGLSNNRLQAGKLDEAEALARHVLKRAPNMAEAHTMLGLIASRRGDSQIAGEHYRQAAELAPQQGSALNNYGAWLCANGHPTEALAWFDRAMTDPRYGSPPTVLANAGDCALRAGQSERGVRELRRALELDPANAVALESMARNEYAQQRHFQARAFAERRLAAAPVTASVLQLAIQIELGLGDKAAASRYRQRLNEEFPEPAAAHPEG